MAVVEARLMTSNRFSPLPIEVGGGDNMPLPPARSYTAAATSPGAQQAPRRHAPALDALLPGSIMPLPAYHWPKCETCLVSSIQLPQGSSTSRMRSGNILVQTGSADKAALCCTASLAGLEVATPVGCHGLVLHYVVRIEDALEDVVRALEKRAPEGREVVRGRPRWLGAGRCDHGSVLVLLWDTALVGTLCSGSGDLLSTSLGRLKCERAREGRVRGMTRPLPSELAAAAAAVGPSAVGAAGARAAQQHSDKHRAQQGGTRGEEAGLAEDKGPAPPRLALAARKTRQVGPSSQLASRTGWFCQEEMAEQVSHNFMYSSSDTTSPNAHASEAANAPADPSPATAFLEELLSSPTEAGTPPRSSSTSARAPSLSTSWRSGTSDAGDAGDAVDKVDEGANKPWADEYERTFLGDGLLPSGSPAQSDVEDESIDMEGEGGEGEGELRASKTEDEEEEPPLGLATPPNWVLLPAPLGGVARSVALVRKKWAALTYAQVAVASHDVVALDLCAGGQS
ncbi:hypothetical protein DMC30DRAFT_409574, partial [Rhodotorula diobovata]